MTDKTIVTTEVDEIEVEVQKYLKVIKDLLEKTFPKAEIFLHITKTCGSYREPEKCFMLHWRIDCKAERNLFGFNVIAKPRFKDRLDAATYYDPSDVVNLTFDCLQYICKQ